LLGVGSIFAKLFKELTGSDTVEIEVFEFETDRYIKGHRGYAVKLVTKWIAKHTAPYEILFHTV